MAIAPMAAADRLTLRQSAKRLPLSGLSLLAAACLLLMAAIAILVPILSGQPLGRIDLSVTFQPPVWSGGSWAYPLGTDNLGRDLLTRIAYGARVSLVVAAVVALAASAFGTLMGLVTGYFGGWVDAVAARIVEAQLSLPLLVVALSIVVALGPSLRTVILAIAISSWVPFARVVRSEVLVLRNADFVKLAITTGLTPATILRRHVLPNVMPSVIVLASQTFGQAIIYEASLSYLSLGVQPPQVSWGLMIAQSRIYLISHAWLVLAPALSLAITALSANIVGDRLRDRLDPTLEVVQ